MDLANLDVQVVDQALMTEGYFIVRDKQFEQLCVAARKEYEICFKNTKPRSPAEKFDYKMLKNEPWRKMAIGSRNGLKESISQNLQTTYFSETDQNFPFLSSLFQEMIKVRNKLMRVDEDF